MGGNKPNGFLNQIYLTESRLRREMKECLWAQRERERESAAELSYNH